MLLSQEYQAPYMIHVEWNCVDRAYDYAYWSCCVWFDHYNSFCDQRGVKRVETYVWVDDEIGYRMEHIWDNPNPG